MSKITITDSDGHAFTGRLPESWADVPLAQYATLAAALDWPARCRALAALCGLPEQPLLDDVGLCGPILRSAPFLLNGPLPAATDTPSTSFQHLGVTYGPAPADLERINGGQMEALLGFLRDHQGDPLACAPHLLAILYKPEGSKPLFGKAKEVQLTADVVVASARAFASLPMSVAWPLVQSFLSRSAPMAMLFQKYSAARQAAEQMLSALETACTTSVQPGFCSNSVRWLTKAYLRRVRKAL